MNLYVTISLTLLTILAALWYLIKVKNENHGPFYKWSGYLVLIAATGLFLWLVFKGARKMSRRNHNASVECIHGAKNMKGMKSMHAGCSVGENCCCSGESGKMERKIMRNNRESEITESTRDTVDGKINEKEITITR